jgi:hypothetical protein
VHIFLNSLLCLHCGCIYFTSMPAALLALDVAVVDNWHAELRRN